MQLIDLQNQIKTNQLQNIYIFTGEEIAVQKIYINKMANISNLEIQYVDNLNSIYNKLNVNDILQVRKLYIIIDDEDYLKNSSLWNNLDTGSNTVIFKYNNLDKRSKFYNNFKDKIIEFNRLSDSILTKYIQKELNPFSIENSKELIDICDGNYNQILLEIDKIDQYRQSIDKGQNIYSYDYNTIFNFLDTKGAFHKEISDITFEFIDKVLRKDYQSIFDLRKKLVQIGESNIKLLSLLYTNFKTILLIQCCNSNDICKTTGLQYYQVKYNQDKLGYYSNQELVKILKLIQNTEEKIKTGEIEEELSIDYVLDEILFTED